MLDAVTVDLATVGLLGRGSMGKRAEMARALVFLVGDTQSLISSTMTNLSLLEKSGPLEFLMGPMGAEMMGRGVLSRSPSREAVLEDEAFLSHEVVRDLTSFGAVDASIIDVLCSRREAKVCGGNKDAEFIANHMSVACCLRR